MKNKNTPPVILLNMAVDVINGRENDVIISQYVERVSDSGAVPMLIPSIEKEQNIETLLDLADGVVFIGGRDYDARDFGEEGEQNDVGNTNHQNQTEDIPNDILQEVNRENFFLHPFEPRRFAFKVNTDSFFAFFHNSYVILRVIHALLPP